jgi:hypothetical protein
MAQGQATAPAAKRAQALAVGFRKGANRLGLDQQCRRRALRGPAANALVDRVVDPCQEKRGFARNRSSNHVSLHGCAWV